MSTGFITYVNIDLRHQYGISFSEEQLEKECISFCFFQNVVES